MADNPQQTNWPRLAALLAIAGAGACLFVYLTWQEPTPYSSNSNYSSLSYDQIGEFKSDAPSNARPVENFEDLMFQTVQGEAIDLKSFLGKKNVVLVITRGLTGTLASPGSSAGPGEICPYCASQTSRLITNYPEFAKRNAEVVVVFPVIKSEQVPRIAEFEKAANQAGNRNEKAAIPFPTWLDVELKTVDALGIRKDLSKPATYIVDQDGKVRYAYVGESMVDRPSASAVLKQLDEINQSEA